MDRMEQVKHLRTDPGGRHYNCAQSILVPFAGEAGLEEEQAYQLGACLLYTSAFCRPALYALINLW